MGKIENALTAEFGKMNGKFRVVSIAHLEELREEIDGLRCEGKINEQVHEKYLSGSRFEKPEEIPDAKSIIVIAIPQGMALLDFISQGKHHRGVIPPTYIYEEIRNACSAILSRVFGGTGNKVARAVLPLKLLAVRSGLGKYGRNNICYVGGMGSFHRLEAFYTDYAFGVDNWQEKEMMDSCVNCFLCMKACPNNVIRTDRFLVHAERCLTFFNENEEPFPEWIDPRAHNAIVGCMKCQIACPKNRDFILAKGISETFSEEDTWAILNGTPMDSLPEGLSAKIKRVNMDGYYSMLPRNLTLLMKRQ